MDTDTKMVRLADCHNRQGYCRNSQGHWDEWASHSNRGHDYQLSCSRTRSFPEKLAQGQSRNHPQASAIQMKIRLKVLFTKSRPMKRRNKVLPRKVKHKGKDNTWNHQQNLFLLGGGHSKRIITDSLISMIGSLFNKGQSILFLIGVIGVLFAKATWIGDWNIGVQLA